MKRPWSAVLISLVLMSIGTSLVYARGMQKQVSDLVVGAQLYDNWYAALRVDAPSGEMPIWGRQSTNTRSGGDTWRCSECHGWDYKGVNGSYAIGSHQTGFPGVLESRLLSREELIAELKGARDQAHDYTAFLDDAALQKLVLFLNEGLIDDSEFIDSVSLKVIDGNVGHGQELYDSTCTTCHGPDGMTIISRGEGVAESLSDVANRDPYRFLHRTRFGVAGTETTIGFDLGWKPEDGRDLLAYVQTLPSAGEPAPVPPAGEGSKPAPQDLGGPSDNPIAGIITGILAALGTIGSAVLFLAVLVLLGAAVVFGLRRQK